MLRISATFALVIVALIWQGAKAAPLPAEDVMPRAPQTETIPGLVASIQGETVGYVAAILGETPPEIPGFLGPLGL